MNKFLITFFSLCLTWMAHSASFKVASVEFNPKLMEFEKNIIKIHELTEQAAKQGAKLIVFPEMASTGLIYHDRAQINPFLDTIPGKTTKNIEAICQKYQVYVVVGIAEIDPNSHLSYNSAALIGPDGYIGKYRKNGLNALDEKWASRGNLGVPVFETTLGKIALLICYDNTYLEYLLLASVRGADIIAYITSPGRLLARDPGAIFNHSTIANITTLSEWLGTYIVASSRSNIEINPITHQQIYYVGGASIWDPQGNKLAQAGIASYDTPLPEEIIYAKIDTDYFKNDAKNILEKRRKPSLYESLNLSKTPINLEASSSSKHINALILQYSPQEFNKQQNLKIIQNLIHKSARQNFNLLVLPQNSLIGSTNPKDMINQAEQLEGESFQKLSQLAKSHHCFIVFSMPEIDHDKYYSSVILINDQGKISAVYHKSHLNDEESQWATEGQEIPVFDTKLGRIGFMIGDEVRIPDLSNVMAMKRADMIIIPSAWNGNYGTPIRVDPKLLKKTYPQYTMTFWYNIAKFSQAYTLVANYVGGKQNYQGSSALYSLDPVEDHYIPITASNQKEQTLYVSFDTLGKKDWWINQQYLIDGKRSELHAPLTLDYSSPCFKNWRENSTKHHFCWDN